jgi:hypothetical protein
VPFEALLVATGVTAGLLVVALPLLLDELSAIGVDDEEDCGVRSGELGASLSL